MKSLNMVDNGEEFFPKTAYDAAVFYVSGSLGGATVNIKVLDNVLGEIATDAPLLLVFGTGAPLKVEVVGGSGVDLTVTAYPVE